MSAEIKSELAQFAAKLKAAFIEKADAVFDEAQARLLTQEIIGDLNKAKASAVKSLLGIEQKYRGEMAFDHCNGRQGAIDQMLTEIARPVLRDWVRAAFDEFKNSPAFATAREATKKAIIRQVKDQMSYSHEIQEGARMIADELREQALSELRKELGITK